MSTEVYTDEVGHHGSIRLNEVVVVTTYAGNPAYGRVTKIVAGDQGGAMITVASLRTGKVNHYSADRVSPLVGMGAH